MIILGLSSLDNESTASLVIDGRLVAAASEERFTRVKQQNGFPDRAIETVLAIGGIGAADVEAITYPWFRWEYESWLLLKAFLADLPFALTNDAPIASRLVHLANYLRITLSPGVLARSDRWLREGLRRFGWPASRLVRVDHQLAHAASAFWTSGQDRALILTLDGYGSGAAGAVFVGEGRTIRRVQSFAYPHSFGGYYWRLTKALGFRPLRHEGKILGLAAYGDPRVLAGEILRRFDCSSEDTYRIKAAQDFLIEPRHAARFRREDMAAGYQHVMETVVSRYVSRFASRLGLRRVAAAGGVMANVKLNQRIAELREVDELWVHPAMADMGLGTGSALAVAAAREPAGVQFERMRHAYLGPDNPERAIVAALQACPFPHRRSACIQREIAGLLRDGRVVARCTGRMEYGPRALGHRSILCRAQDPRVNAWLNDRLKRTEFMPFAPITLAADAPDRYVGLKKIAGAARFMTVTADCTDLMRTESPAAVHVDGTARPQIVDADGNPDLHAILIEYKKLTGIPTLINTSFNMHEEPIVCTAADALKGFADGRLDYLALGDFLVGPHPGAGGSLEPCGP
ncbi:MAG: carbamoyltransferase [Acidobacteria bacterium]|nr:carbamoyltransferase [Acidobacteriota bacterium]